MVDIHCHILPGIDDGAETWATTTQMCRMAVRDGITHIVATPHCDGHYEYDRAHFTDMLATLSEVSGGQLTFTIGCDFHLSPRNIEAAMGDPRPFAVGDTQYIMVEFDHHGIPSNAGELLRTLLSRGMVPIITHPERNALLMKKLERGAGVHRDGLPVAGDGQRVHRILGAEVEEGGGEAAAEEGDPHCGERRARLELRPPVLSTARTRVATLAGADVAEALFTHNPAAVVAGQNVTSR